MNGVALCDLIVALAPLMPSEEASPRASIEWRLARAAWLRGIAELRLTEETVRDLAGRRRALSDDAGRMQ